MSDFLKTTVAALAVAITLPAAAAAQETMEVTDVAEGLMSMDGSVEAATEAPGGWHNCQVVRTGAGWGNHYAALTCPSGPFTNTWHIISAAQKDEMLATALAAAASDNEVQVFIHEQSGYNEIRALYLHK